MRALEVRAFVWVGVGARVCMRVWRHLASGVCASSGVVKVLARGPSQRHPLLVGRHHVRVYFRRRPRAHERFILLIPQVLPHIPPQLGPGLLAGRPPFVLHLPVIPPTVHRVLLYNLPWLSRFDPRRRAAFWQRRGCVFDLFVFVQELALLGVCKAGVETGLPRKEPRIESRRCHGCACVYT